MDSWQEIKNRKVSEVTPHCPKLPHFTVRKEETEIIIRGHINRFLSVSQRLHGLRICQITDATEETNLLEMW